LEYRDTDLDIDLDTDKDLEILDPENETEEPLSSEV